MKFDRNRKIDDEEIFGKNFSKSVLKTSNEKLNDSGIKVIYR